MLGMLGGFKKIMVVRFFTHSLTQPGKCIPARTQAAFRVHSVTEGAHPEVEMAGADPPDAAMAFFFSRTCRARSSFWRRRSRSCRRWASRLS
jgi:hypothetical protein